MSRLIVLMRHGIAEARSDERADAERPLTMRGRGRARAAAMGLRRLVGRTDAIWSSPLLRAQQTADEVARAWRDRHTVRLVDELQPDTDPADLIALITSAAETRLILVGHEPLLSTVASGLLGKGPALPELRKCGCYGIGLPGESDAELRFLLSPRLLRRAGR